MSSNQLVMNAGPDEFASQDTAKRRLSLKPLLAPFISIGSLIAAIMRLVRAIVERIGRAFGVRTKINNSPDGPAGSPVGSDVEFSAEGYRPEDHARVEAATEQASVELGDTLREILSTRPDKLAMTSPGGDAYMGLRLHELGSALKEVQAKITSKTAGLEKVAIALARSTGIPSDSLLAHMLSVDPSTPEAIRDFPAEALELVKSRNELMEQRCHLQLGFCDFARQAMTCGNPAVVDVVNSKTAEFADEDMRAAISGAVARESEAASPSVVEEASQVVAGSIEASAADTTPQVPRPLVVPDAKVVRSRFANRSAGIGFEDEDQDTEKSARERG